MDATTKLLKCSKCDHIERQEVNIVLGMYDYMVTCEVCTNDTMNICNLTT